MSEKQQKARKDKETRTPGKPITQPYTPPPVEVGETVLYMDGFYNPHIPGQPAIVTVVGPRAIELSIIAPERETIRVVANSVRHKDDPEVARLAAVNAEEGETFGVWWRPPWSLSPEDVRRLRLLLGMYGDEIAQMEGDGRLDKITTPANGEGAGDSATA
jgi:hypothetical protein